MRRTGAPSKPAGARPGLWEAILALSWVERMCVPASLGLAALFGAVCHHAAHAGWSPRAELLLLPIGALAGLPGLLLLRDLALLVARSRSMDADLAQYRLIADHAGDMMLHIGPDGLRYASPSTRDILGFLPAELAGEHWLDIVHPDDQPRIRAEIASVRSCDEQHTLEYRCRRRDGTECWLEAHIRPVHGPVHGLGHGPGQDKAGAESGGALIDARDVTRRKQAEDRLAEIAATDALTNLANRRRFDQLLDQEWRRCMREQQPLALLLLDADRFKDYNDRYGHQRGDELLRVVATRVATCTRRPADFVARYGGEEFAVVLPATETSGAALVAEYIRQAVAGLREPHLGNLDGFATVSIGVAAMLPVPGMTSAALVQAADQALYAAKRAGRNRIETATPAFPPYNPDRIGI